MMNDCFLESTNCNLCGADDFKEYLEQTDHRYSETPRDVFKLVKCNKCGLIYLNPRPTKEYIQKFYPSSFYEPRKLGNKAKEGTLETIAKIFVLPHILKSKALQEKISIVEKYHSTNGKILDIGSCSAKFLSAMKTKGWDVLGIEISKSMCDYALKTYNINCINSNVTDLGINDLKDNHFDIITLWATLAHIDDPKQALRLCHHALKPGGKVIILTSNADSLEEKWFKKIDRNPIDIPRHLYHFNTRSMSQYFRLTGFSIKEIRYFTLNASDRLTVILNSTINKIPTNNIAIKVVKYSLINISTLCGYMLSMLLCVLKRSHTIVIVGEKAGR